MPTGGPDPVAPGIWRVTHERFGSNTYLCSTGSNRDALLIDPGLEGDRVEEALAALELVPTAILCTHGHFDHIGSAARFQRRHRAPVYLHPADLKTAKASNFLLMAFKVEQRIEVPRIDVAIADQLALTLGDREVSFHEAPGHTPGSCAVRVDDVVFTGDTLYSRGVGLSQLPGADLEQLKRSVVRLFEIFEDDCLILPGHGRGSTLRDIRLHNQALRELLGPLALNV